jgi:hypothetical protein
VPHRISVKKAAKLPAKEQLFRWRISRIRATPAVEIGSVYAPDANEAIHRAIEEFGISNPDHQKRLMARRVS